MLLIRYAPRTLQNVQLIAGSDSRYKAFTVESKLAEVLVDDAKPNCFEQRVV